MLTIANPHRPHVAARTCIDMNAGRWSPVLKPGRAPATLRRIKHGYDNLGDEFLVPYFGRTYTCRSLDRPIGTLTTTDRYAVVKKGMMRMLTAQEARLFMGFPAWYQLPSDHRDAMKLLGNAVTPPVMAYLIDRLKAAFPGMIDTAIDLFAGLGGNTVAATQAGVRVVYAANHWPEAVRIHSLNHPNCRHDCQDLRQANFFNLPDFSLMLASPACQGHSVARGEDKPHHDECRSTAWAVWECAQAKRPPFIIVENVEEFMTRWGEPKDRSCHYRLWKQGFVNMGYRIKEHVFDSADFGVPQNRLRVYVVMVHEAVGQLQAA